MFILNNFLKKLIRNIFKREVVQKGEVKFNRLKNYIIKNHWKNDNGWMTVWVDRTVVINDNQKNIIKKQINSFNSDKFFLLFVGYDEKDNTIHAFIEHDDGNNGLICDWVDIDVEFLGEIF